MGLATRDPVVRLGLAAATSSDARLPRRDGAGVARATAGRCTGRQGSPWWCWSIEYDKPIVGSTARPALA